MNKADWLNLVRTGEWATLEDRWLAAVEDPETDQGVLLAVLDTTSRAGEGPRAATLAWMWLTALCERSTPAEVIDLAREIVVNSPGSDPLRTQVADIYKQVHADRPGMAGLIEASGLLGGRTPRRALRTIDIGLQAVPGTYLMSRTDERPAVVVAADLATNCFTLRTPRGTVEVDADRLASDYNLADPNDFRVLAGLEPERMASLIAEDPAELVIGMLRARGGRMDADDVKYALVPAHLSAEEWAKWWSRARAALKRHHNVRVEGRTPVTLTYDESGASLDDEIREQWHQARTAEARLSVIDTYLREARSRKVPVDRNLLAEWAKAWSARVESHRSYPAEAMRAAVIVERLRQSGHVDATGRSPVESILAEAVDPAGLLREFAPTGLIHLMLDAAIAALPDRWPDVFAEVLPTAPPDVCDDLAAHLIKAGRGDALQALILQIPAQPLENLPAIGWLWRGSASIEGLTVPSRVELFSRMMSLLSELARHEDTPPATLKAARATVRNALSFRKCGVFREMIEPLAPEMVRTIHRQVSRTPGLSSAMVHDLKKIIHERFPSLFEKPRPDPWEDASVLYTTEAGRAKAEAELNHIVNVKMPENARAIGAAAAHGDLSENSEYKFALEERDLLRARVAAIQNDLARARVLEPYLVPSDRVGVGNRVVVRSVEGSVEREMVFLGPWDADIDRHIYNYKAPMSQRMMNLRVGDTVELNLDGVDREYRVEAITSAV